MNIRERTEERELQELNPYASFSRMSRGRQLKEEECDIRTVFQRDRDRILHCKSFRRLKDKTQVFLAPKGDHYRTRLTHTLEVSQIARTVARALKLNEDLVEAISLGHDLGHTPFGHAGERALNAVSKTGFQHHVQSLRVADTLERDGHGLNLTWEVRDGILNHRTGGTPSTLEGKIVQYCDKIAYMHHDMDDAQRAGLISEDDIPITLRVTLGGSVKERLDTLIHDLISNSYQKDSITMSADILDAMKHLRETMFQVVYKNPQVVSEDQRAKRLIQSLYEYYDVHPMKMAEEYRQLLEQGTDKNTVICDYISGMTDQYSMHVYHEIFVPKSWSVY